MSKTRIVVVSNRLPVNITQEAGELVLKRSLGGLATALGSVMNSHPMLWIGWPGTWQRLTKQQLIKLNFPDLLVPVLISKRQLTRYYNRVSNGVLWPLLHGIKPAKLDQEADWKAAREVINLFADAVQANLKEDDVIWIHDYHLQLLPRVLRERGITNRIGFFLHTPFPPAAIFIQWRHHRQILESMITVDVLGFQTKRDVQNFQDCLKAANLQVRPGAVVKAFPIGIDYKAYRSAERRLDVMTYLKRLRLLKPAGTQLILSASRLDYTKGIISQLLAVEKILEHYAPGKVEYRMVVAPSREDLTEYQDLRERIAQEVERVNTRFHERHGVTPISFEYRSHGFEELNAWYRVADVFLVTPIMDGMNLMVKEYIAARGGRLGAVVLSETIGAAWQLRDAILVNPASVDDIAHGLKHALRMRLPEQARRWNALLRNVRQQDVFWWTDSFLMQLFEREPVPAPRGAHASQIR